MRHKMIVLELLISVLLAGITGCFSSNPRDIEAFVMPDEVVVTSARYILEPPDEIEIHCSKVPELHLQTQMIRPDGKVTFEAVGEITAAGKTPQQVAALIEAKVRRLYNLTGENSINVRLVENESKYYYVLGQVFFEGPKTYTGRDKLLTAVAEARPTTLAWTHKIQVVRPANAQSEKARIFEVDYDKMIAHGDASKNVLLQEGDIVYVPPTILATIGLVVEELLSPIARAFGTVNVVQGTPAPR